MRFGRAAGNALAFWAAAAAAAQEPPAAAPEYRIKAAFLYNFTLYTEWPAGSFADAASPIVLGVIGRDPFGSELEATLKAKKVQGRGFEVKRSTSLEDLKGCHLLFVPASEKENAPKIVEACRRRAVLTVGESSGFAAGGGVVGFTIEDNRVRFEINPDSAEQAGLKISSKLLNLARIVKPSKEKRE